MFWTLGLPLNVMYSASWICRNAKIGMQYCVTWILLVDSSHVILCSFTFRFWLEQATWKHSNNNQMWSRRHLLLLVDKSTRSRKCLLVHITWPQWPAVKACPLPTATLQHLLSNPTSYAFWASSVSGTVLLSYEYHRRNTVLVCVAIIQFCTAVWCNLKPCCGTS